MTPNRFGPSSGRSDQLLHEQAIALLEDVQRQQQPGEEHAAEGEQRDPLDVADARLRRRYVSRAGSPARAYGRTAFPGLCPRIGLWSVQRCGLLDTSEGRR